MLWRNEGDRIPPAEDVIPQTSLGDCTWLAACPTVDVRMLYKYSALDDGNRHNTLKSRMIFGTHTVTFLKYTRMYSEALETVSMLTELLMAKAMLLKMFKCFKCIVFGNIY